MRGNCHKGSTGWKVDNTNDGKKERLGVTKRLILTDAGEDGERTKLLGFLEGEVADGNQKVGRRRKHLGGGMRVGGWRRCV